MKTIFGVTERNIINPEVVDSIFPSLYTDNAHINNWVSSTLRKFLLHNLPVTEIVPVWVYRSFLLSTVSARITDNLTAAAQKELLIYTCVPVAAEHPDWVKVALLEDKTVQILRTDRLTQDSFDFTKVDVKVELSTLPISLNSLRHWVDYLVTLSPMKQIRDTVEVVHEKTVRWSHKMAAQKLLEEQVSDVALVPLLCLNDTDYYLVKLVTQDAYKREGTLMRSCVSSYWSRPTDIFSLRSIGQIKPLATIELGLPSDTPLLVERVTGVKPELLCYDQTSVPKGTRLYHAEAFAKQPFAPEVKNTLEAVYKELELVKRPDPNLTGLYNISIGPAGGGGGAGGFGGGASAINSYLGIAANAHHGEGQLINILDLDAGQLTCMDNTITASIVPDANWTTPATVEKISLSTRVSSAFARLRNYIHRRSTTGEV